MSILYNILHGIISGITEFLPVSLQAHQALMHRIFGIEAIAPLRSIFIRIGLLLALLTACRTIIMRLKKEKALASRPRRIRGTERKGLFDLRLVRTATLPLLAGLLAVFFTGTMDFDLIVLALILIVNGVIILYPAYMPQGNKDSSAMTGLDAILMGVSGALSALPGISRMGAVLSVATARGADKNHALNWALLLSIPAIVLTLIADIVNLFIFGVQGISFTVLLGCAICGVFAFIGGRMGIGLIRYLTFRTGFAGFAYYSWGMALFAFILYLIT